MKNIIFILLFVIVSMSAKDIYIMLDNNNSMPFRIETSILKKSLKKRLLHKRGIKHIYLFSETKGLIKRVVSRELPSKADFRRVNMDNGIIDTLNMLVTPKYKNGDIIILISSLDYREPTTKTDSTGKIYNDAWITSIKSPLKKIINSHPDMPLNGIKLIVLDPNKNIKYLHSRERFFSYFFSKLGAEMIFYGGLNKDKKRVIDYISSKKVFNKIYQSSPLRKENILMLDDNVIQYELP